MFPVPGAFSLLAVAASLALTGGTAHVQAEKKPPLRRTVTVMTRNLYLGADLDPVVKATSFSGALKAVAAGWAQVQANDFPTRARAIAAEIARAKPDFVGFQELVLSTTSSA